jgi:hypothetical protein
MMEMRHMAVFKLAPVAAAWVLMRLVAQLLFGVAVAVGRV